MEKKKKLIVPTLMSLAIVGLIASFIFVTVSNIASMGDDSAEEVVYEEESVPVVEEPTEQTIIEPYVAENVEPVTKYYDYLGDEATQVEAIVEYDENKYSQSNGVDYVSEEAFDVVSVLDGTVTKVTEDPLLGQTVEVTHDNGVVTVYQSLGEVSVSEDQAVSQGDVIGVAGTNNFASDLGIHVHFQVYKDNVSLNPEDIYGKALSEL